MDSVTVWVVTRARELLATFTDREEMAAYLRRQTSLNGTWVQETKPGGKTHPEGMYHASRYCA